MDNSMPDCPDSLSEPQYAALVFGHHCQVSTPPIRPLRLNELAHIRLAECHGPAKLTMFMESGCADHVTKRSEH